jgi:predicted XRE-type DNA-binding protein
MSTEIAEPTVALLQFTANQSANFWRKVAKTDGCWIWNGCKVHDGYGQFGVNRKMTLTHRLSYMIHVGPIPEGLFVCHKCDNPPCCNPDHLWLGTKAQNMADCVKKNRNAKGESQGNAKLTAEQVLEIRARYATRNIFQRRLAKEYGVSQIEISRIIRGEKWSHIQPEST